MVEDYSVEENEIVEQEKTQNKKKFGVSVKKLAGSVGEKAGIMAQKSTEVFDKSKDAVFHAIDVNGDGQIDIEDVILMAFMQFVLSQFSQKRRMINPTV